MFTYESLTTLWKYHRMRHYIRNFIQHETFGGLCLIVATMLALAFANSPWGGYYVSFLEMPVKIGAEAGPYLIGLEKPVQLWINDALMALFFLLIGLEIKRELVIGELSTREKALQPVLAALGGMIFPVLFYLSMNFDNPETIRGWAIACATDIAFALGILTLAGKRVPVFAKILLTAIAIVDDLLAIVIIALFYTAELHAHYLWVAVLGGGMLFMLNRMQSTRISLYVMTGIAIWYAFLKAGLHPTLAGVVTAMAVPLEVREKGVSRSPLMRMEHGLHGWVILCIIPIFAFANAGLDFSGMSAADLTRPLSLGIILGLVLGKPIGVMCGLYVGHVTRWARKPDDVMWRHYACISILCGVGFTVALFIGKLAFAEPWHISQLKLGILFASFIMAVMGFTACRLFFRVNTTSSIPLTPKG